LTDGRLPTIGHSSYCSPMRAIQRLTPRETEVLGWVARGHTNKEVAAILGTSPHTVRTQLEHVFEKLDVHTRTGAVAKAQTELSAGGGRTA
jgi:DNA-binding CsgD family transcriptional regulator